MTKVTTTSYVITLVVRERQQLTIYIRIMKVYLSNKTNTNLNDTISRFNSGHFPYTQLFYVSKKILPHCLKGWRFIAHKI